MHTQKERLEEPEPVSRRKLTKWTFNKFDSVKYLEVKIGVSIGRSILRI